MVVAEPRSTNPTRTARRRGFSLLEVAVTVAIIGVMSSIAAATLREVALTNRETGGAQTLAGALRRARAQAINTHSRVRIDTTTAGLAFSSCPARYGATACAGTSTFSTLALAGTDFSTSTDFAGLQVTAPATTLIFGPTGFPETIATYIWTVDHRELPGDKKIVVSGGGEIRVQ
jgi:prepilin-type N-terminal cleavage/methylation domain-containing protein